MEATASRATDTLNQPDGAGDHAIADHAIERTFTWAELPIDDIGATVSLTSVLRAPNPSDKTDIIVRFEFVDETGGQLSEDIPGIGHSTGAGHYIYPLKLATASSGDGEDKQFLFFRFRPPAAAVKVRVAFQQWKKTAPTGYRAEATSIRIEYAQVEVEADIDDRGEDASELVFLERSLERQATEYAKTMLRSDLMSLRVGEFPFLERAATAHVLKSRSPTLGKSLARRLLRAGRSRDAVEIARSIPLPFLDREVGRIAVHDATANVVAPDVVKSFGSPKKGLYLLHNCFPYHSGGYAARAEGVISGMEAEGVKLVPLARLGYPSDRGKGASDGAKDVVHDGITFHLLPADAEVDQADGEGYIAEYADRIVKFASRRKPDFIQAASFYHNAMAGRIAADRLGIPLIYEMRGLEWFTRGSIDAEWFESDQGRMMRDLEVRAALQADHVYAITQALAEWLVEQGVPRERIGLLPNGCDPSAFQPQPRSDALAQELGIGSDEFILGYLGSVVFYEGVELAAEAVQRARRAGAKIRLLLVGDGPYFERLLQILDEKRLREACIITGRVPHAKIPEYYSLIDALALPRRNLPVCNYISPLKPFESMAMKKPLIASDVAAVKEIVDASGAGFTFPADDVDALTHLLIEVSGNRDALAERGVAGRKWVETTRNWAAIARNGLNSLPK